MICRRPCKCSGIFCSVVLCVCRRNLCIRVCHVSGRIIKSHTVAVADGNEQGTVLCLLYQPLTALYITPTLIPVSLDACLIDTPSFSALRRTSSRLPLSNL